MLKNTKNYRCRHKNDFSEKLTIMLKNTKNYRCRHKNDFSEKLTIMLKNTKNYRCRHKNDFSEKFTIMLKNTKNYINDRTTLLVIKIGSCSNEPCVMCACAFMHLRLVSTDKILHLMNTLITVCIYISLCRQDFALYEYFNYYYY